MPLDPSDTVIISRFNRGIAVAYWALAAVTTIVGVLVERALPVVPLVLWGAIAVFYLFWRPSLTIGDESIGVQNVLRRIEIPWEALIHVDTKYSLTLHVPGRAWSVWCAPAPGASGALRASRRERDFAAAQQDGERVRPGDLIGSESGYAAAAVKEKWAQLRERGAIDAGRADTTTVAVRWDLPALVIMAGGAVAALAASSLLR